MADQVRIAVVDSYPIFREAVVEALGREPGIAVVAEGGTAEEAEQFVRENRVNVLLIEVAVPGSLKVAQTILEMQCKVKVIFLASIEDHEHAAHAVQIGVHGYVMKGITGPDLVKTIRAILKGERYITPDLAWHLVTRPASLPVRRDSSRRSSLSIREQQVLDCTSKGLTNQEIARTLGLALSTIKYYKTMAFRKIGARNRLEAMVATSKIVKQS